MPQIRYSLPNLDTSSTLSTDDEDGAEGFAVLRERQVEMTILGEGNTPFIASSIHARLFFKLKTCHPSGSYKDRFAAAHPQAIPDRRLLPRAPVSNCDALFSSIRKRRQENWRRCSRTELRWYE